MSSFRRRPEPARVIDVRCSAMLPHAVMFAQCGERRVRTWRRMFGFPTPARVESEPTGEPAG